LVRRGRHFHLQRFLQPTTPGVYTEWLTVTDSLGRTASGSCSVSVQQGTGSALTILTSTTLPYGTAGTPYSTTLQARGGTTPYTWSLIGSLPLGLSLSPSGVLSGTPTIAGTYTFHIQVADSSAHTFASQFAVTISAGAPQSGIQISQGFPQFSGGYPGAQHQFLFHFTDPLGLSDISGGQILFNTDTTGPSGTPACQLDWYVNGQLDINGAVYGTFGGAPLSSTYCTVYAVSSSLTQVALGYDVTIVISFTDPLADSNIPAQTRGISQSGAISAWTPVGMYSLHASTTGTPRANITLNNAGQPYCDNGNTLYLGGLVSRYADGTIAADIQVGTGQTTGSPGGGGTYIYCWQSTAQRGRVFLNGGTPVAPLANPASVQAGDMDIEELPLGPTGPNNPSGLYTVYGDFTFSNPNCYLSGVDIDFPYELTDDHTVIFVGYGEDSNVSGQAVDPTPQITNITPNQISIGQTQVTISGNGFGTLAEGINWTV